nr:AAA family ATPase [Chloroflexota bacterium]
MSDIRQWLGALGLTQYGDAFEANDIDLSLLPDLNDQALKDIGVASTGHRLRLLAAARAAGAKSVTVDQDDARPSHPEKPSPEPISGQFPSGERRQLTVMFCDLVGSTALSEKLDPEELRSVLHDYRIRCGEVISRYEGFVARYVGDGILTYFGWPTAHEDDAERAVRAALEITQTIKQASTTQKLSVRIGIATGPVVVGAQAGEGSEAKLAVGSTPNLAARLQGLAAGDQIVIAVSTRHLIGNAFELADLGEHELKGISEPVHAWRVIEVSEAASRFEASHGAQLTPLVGREQEIGLLLDRWQLAQQSEGQVVLLSGEPGIGKSRSLSALRERLEAQGAQALRFQCSPYYLNSAFWPSIDNFERALKFKRDETPESKLDKLEALIVNEYSRPIADVRFIASMLSIPCEERYGAITMTPQKHKDETLRTLVDLTEAAAHKQPSMMLYEDMHWADPTSLEALDLLIDRVRTIPLLIVLTHRPEFQSRWAQHGHVTSLNLSKLTRTQSAAMVSKLAGDKALPGDLLEQILAKTDGVPLYVEELTKSILESGELKTPAITTITPVP